MEEIRKKGHFVEIRNELYDKIKQYCQLNNLKVVKFINETLEKSFMVELYGETPFSTGKMFYKPEEMVQIPTEIQRVIADHWWEMLDNDESKKEEAHEIINETKEEENSINKENDLSNLDKQAQDIIDEHMKKLEEKSNKPIKRRLK